MPHEIESLVREFTRERVTEAQTFARIRTQIEQLLEQLEAANQRLDTAAELLGECMAVVSPDTQETIAEAVAAWPKDTLRHFHESERGARAGANAPLRRAS